jgi:hypothetical protein
LKAKHDGIPVVEKSEIDCGPGEGLLSADFARRLDGPRPPWSSS